MPSTKNYYPLKLKTAIELLCVEQPSVVEAKENYKALKKAFEVHRFSNQLISLVTQAYTTFVSEIDNWSRVINAVNRKIILIEAIRIQLERIPNDPGLHIKLEGTWIWVYGQTYRNKDKLSSLNFKYNSARKEWYWSPVTNKKVYEIKNTGDDDYDYTRSDNDDPTKIWDNYDFDPT